ncbi:MAG: 2-isopropylmalate synthase [Elusimicrobiota bacterium]
MSNIQDKNRVIIFDTTLRDGEQSPGASLNTEEKIEIAYQLARLGVDVIEAGFPISSPGEFEAVSLIAKKVRGPQICGLARTIKKDIDACWNAVKYSKRPRIHTFIATSEIHLTTKLKKSQDEVLEMAKSAVKYARTLSPDVEFSAEDASRTDIDYLCRVVEAVIAAGARTVNIPDTVGYALPWQYGETIKTLFNRVPNIDKAIISVHCHNDLGMAVANSLAAVSNGARQVECTINGLGERAGNASLEETVMGIYVRKNALNVTTGIKTPELYRTSKMVSSMTGIVVQPNKAIVGDNAFAHEAGIHQDGLIKNRLTYEIMDIKTVGIPESRLVLGKHSGRHAFVKRLAELGCTLPEKKVEDVFAKFKILTDKKKYVFDEDILALVEESAGKVPEFFELAYHHTSSGTDTIPTATVRLKKEGKSYQEAACGDGPVDAAYRAIDKIAGVHCELLDYSLRALSQGQDALGEVTVKVGYKHDTYVGRGRSTDIIDASVKAYVNALNKIISTKTKGQAVKPKLRAQL